MHDGQRRDQIAVVLHHQLDALLIQIEAVLDALYAVFQGHLDAPCGLCVGGDIAAHILRLLHRRPDLLLTEMAVGSGLISLREHAASGHDLDEIRSVAGVDAAGPPHLIHTVDDEGGAVCPLAASNESF